MTYLDDSKDVPALTGSARVGDYFALLKPRVMSLVIITAIVGMLLAPGSLNPVVAFIALLCISIGAGGSGALNMWYDSDIDAVMSRTRNRPIPSGRVERDDALAIGLIASAFSVMTLGLATNWVAAGFLAFTIFFYAVIYSMWLKRSTPQNIVIGGAAGAFPPMVAWAAVTGTVSIESIALFLIIFMWTPPHFWALALYKQSDYEQAGIPMMPNVAGEKSTKVQILVYSVLLLASTLIPSFIGFSHLPYTAVATATGVWFVVLAWQLYRRTGVEMKKAGKRLFTYSLYYLLIIFLALLADHYLAQFGGF